MVISISKHLNQPVLPVIYLWIKIRVINMLIEFENAKVINSFKNTYAHDIVDLFIC